MPVFVLRTPAGTFTRQMSWDEVMETKELVKAGFRAYYSAGEWDATSIRDREKARRALEALGVDDPDEVLDKIEKARAEREKKLRAEIASKAKRVATAVAGGDAEWLAVFKRKWIGDKRLYKLLARHAKGLPGHPDLLALVGKPEDLASYIVSAAGNAREAGEVLDEIRREAYLVNEEALGEVRRLLAEGATAAVRVRVEKGMLVAEAPDTRDNYALLYGIARPEYWVEGWDQLNRQKVRYKRRFRIGELERRNGRLVLRAPAGMLPALLNAAAAKGIPVKLAEPPRIPSVHFRLRGVKLRKYQEEALEEWEKHGRRMTVALPTGAGKTIIGVAAAAKAGTPFLVLVPTDELRRQWAEKIERYLGVEPVVIRGSKPPKGLGIGEAYIATYQSIATLKKRASADKGAAEILDTLRDRVGLLIADEAHHVPAKTFFEGLSAIPAPMRLGLSATPEREDQNTHLVELMAGPIVFKKELVELARQGFLAPLEFKEHYVPLTADEATRLTEIKRRLREARREENKRLAAKLEAERRKLIANARRKVEKTADLAEQAAREGRKVIVFTIFVDQAKRIASELRRRGIPTSLYYSANPKGPEEIDAYRRGDTRVLVITQAGDEGLDIPDADVGIIASFYKVPRQFIQRMGRLIRWRLGKVATLHLVYTDGDRVAEVRSIVNEIAPQDKIRELIEENKRISEALRLIMPLLGSASKKRPNQLTPREAGALILKRELEKGWLGALMDASRPAKKKARSVASWLRDPSHRDIVVVDTPAARSVARHIASLVKKKRYVEAARYVLRLPTTWKTKRAEKLWRKT